MQLYSSSLCSSEPKFLRNLRYAKHANKKVTKKATEAPKAK